MRIISLIASSTEIVCALGFRDQLVGRSHECDFPEGIKSLPQCTETKFLPDGTSYQIDQRIKAILQEGLSVYRVSAEKLRELNPDVIITQTQCEVCAVSLKDVEAATCGWLGRDVKIVALEPHKLEDLWTDIRSVAEALGAPERAEALCKTLQGRIDAIRTKAAPLPNKPRVACIEWIDPLMTAGNWVPELVEMAGGISLFGEAGKHSPWMSFEELESRDPDTIIVLPCGFDIPRTLEEMPTLVRDPRWPKLRAVRENRVFVADGNQYFNRPGPRLVESLEIMAELFHPDQFNYGHEGSGWVRI